LAKNRILIDISLYLRQISASDSEPNQKIRFITNFYQPELQYFNRRVRQRGGPLSNGKSEPGAIHYVTVDRFFSVGSILQEAGKHAQQPDSQR
jgi:hypothetical protein